MLKLQKFSTFVESYIQFFVLSCNLWFYMYLRDVDLAKIGTVNNRKLNMLCYFYIDTFTVVKESSKSI